MAKRCGAKTRAGGNCQAPAMDNGRCRVHGGASTGPKEQKGNTNAATHGFYSDALRTEEKELWSRVQIGSIDDEIRLMRIKLHRLIKLSGASDVAELIDSAIDVSKKRDTHPALGDFEKSEIKIKVPHYADLILQAVAEIRKLEIQRLQMVLLEQRIAEGGGGDSDVDVVGFDVVPYGDSK